MNDIYCSLAGVRGRDAGVLSCGQLGASRKAKLNLTVLGKVTYNAAFTPDTRSPDTC